MDKIVVEVAFATSDKQEISTVTLAMGSTVQQAIIASGIIKQFPVIDLQKMSVGVFGKVCQLDKVVESGERVEIYRALFVNPMDARRNRAGKSN